MQRSEVDVQEVRQDNGGDATNAAQPTARVDLYWIPLGAGASVVRTSGKLFETISCLLQRRRRRALYHSALEVTVPQGRYVIEMAPVADLHGERRGVVAEGAVGAKCAKRFRMFRYEIRCWRQGSIADASEAPGGPVTATSDLATAQRILDLAWSVPTPVWGRDELARGEMWNSNSVTSWLIARGGINMTPIQPPRGGRAPGWTSGLVVAGRDAAISGVCGPPPPSGRERRGLVRRARWLRRSRRSRG